MQAEKWPGDSSSSGGTVCAQASMACGQRVRNTQPEGGAIGLGMSPFNAMCRVGWSGSGLGLAASSACV